jgi:hypothetical protein
MEALPFGNAGTDDPPPPLFFDNRMRPAVAREITGFGGIYNHAETIRAEGAGSAKKYPFKAFSWALRLKQTHSHYNGSPRPQGAGGKKQ